MFFIHDTTCISAQQTFLEDALFTVGIHKLNQPRNKILYAVEPTYEGIPLGILRRMGRAVRLGVGAAMPLLQKKEKPADGIIIGTSMGGMEDCVKFLNQIIEYNEGTLTPTNFVQSTPNAIAGQLGLLSKNKGYNVTHVHRGFSFENAVIDVDMLLMENPGKNYLLGAVDEIASCNYNIERLDGWYKEAPCSLGELYKTNSPGSIAGEGAAMFTVSDNPRHAVASLSAIHIFHTTDENIVNEQCRQFLHKHLPANELPDLLLSGEGGDNRFRHFYESCELIAGKNVVTARFKHLSGEHPTAAAFGCWIACEIFKKNMVPEHMIKTCGGNSFKRILIYNNYKGIQHSFMLLEKGAGS
ncbi:MAG: beta-ketoacyl synthase chain length factor [Ferruginibacter sp.]|nr:beta-ketoacyl synthase chain length factor [Ferruginibacter sp.]